MMKKKWKIERRTCAERNSILRETWSLYKEEVSHQIEGKYGTNVAETVPYTVSA